MVVARNVWRRSVGRRRGGRSGFTLIELVVVMVIIATIAGFVIPQIGMLGRSSDMAATAKTQSDIANNVQLFFTLQKRYPQGLDSLLDTSGALYSSDSTNGDTQTRGLPYSGADGTRLQAQLVAGQLANATNAEYMRSLTRSGFDWVYDHDTAVLNSNNSATTFRGLIADANGTGNTAPSTINVAELTGTALLAKLVPQGLKSGERVVAFGVGPRNSAISKTLTNAPTYPGSDGKYYGRYVVYFKVYATGERATLVGVSDSYGRTPDYSQQQFNESLPDGGRQG
ncbi:MAG: prepilin-type N-terminal cleavage/methylation domain-containing protein [Planctomycetales bacterium]|nr:prepilin-type N-terminal cleavage/methylation domain-containing protein [Planctomycetales bacterium]MBN8628362.1 prepilin-type N-terminal cleavage/methylation domain-containing protein [Planctomycetota bacterium]